MRAACCSRVRPLHATRRPTRNSPLRRCLGPLEVLLVSVTAQQIRVRTSASHIDLKLVTGRRTQERHDQLADRLRDDFVESLDSLSTISSSATDIKWTRKRFYFVFIYSVCLS